MSFPLFCLWWLSVNSLMYLGECRFFVRIFSDKRVPASCILLYTCGGCILTLFSICFGISPLMRELIHGAAIYIFLSRCLGHRGLEAAFPAVVVFSLSGYMQALNATLMRWSSANLSVAGNGIPLQIALSAVLALLFCFSLHFTAEKFRRGFWLCQIKFYCALLLSCVFVLWAVRFGFGINNVDLAAPVYPFSGLSLLLALTVILSAVFIFFLLLSTFEHLSGLKGEAARLENCLLSQTAYLEDSLKREESLRFLKHDMSNHLTVLSGLLNEGEYCRAKAYLGNLKEAVPTPNRTVFTGHTALDIILREKIYQARLKSISVNCRIFLPTQLTVKDVDLCIIVSNAMDNAIAECAKIENSQIDVTIKTFRSFLLLEFTNQTLLLEPPLYGTGLKSILSTAKRYSGAMECSVENGRFMLSVLLCTEPNMQKKGPFA